jgi:hypothetical protein
MVLMPKPKNCRSNFDVQITKSKLPVLMPKPRNPSPPWFWGSTKKPTTGFEAKPEETITTSFEAKLEKTVATGFEAKLAKTVAAGFEAKPLETVRVVLMPNHSQTVDLGFEAQPRNSRSYSPRARCRLHTVSPDLSTAQPPSTWPVRPSRSSAPGLLLLPRFSSLHVMLHLPPKHHETSKRDSSNETKIKEKQNKTVPDSNSNITKSMTHHNQTKELITWFLIYAGSSSLPSGYIEGGY